MSTVGTCSASAPCGLCAFKKAQSPPVPNLSLSGRGNKPRPQPMKLDPIEVLDKSDFVAVKRANNTMAARKSRQKQINNLVRLEKEVEELSAERNHWKYWVQSIEEQHGFMFPMWMTENAIPMEEIAQTAPRQAISTQHIPMRALPLEATFKQPTTEQTRKG